MLFYYITDRRQFPGSAAQQRRRLLEKIAEAARCGVDFIQLREKDLSTRELEQLAREAVHVIRESSETKPGTRNQQPVTRLLINSRLDVALAAGAAGVHLRSDDISAGDARALCSKAAGYRERQQATGGFTIAVSCHSAAAVRACEAHGADFAVFAPVFEKEGNPGAGLDALRAACLGVMPVSGPEASPGRHFPVLALGGVTQQNARACVEAGAAGIAAIRLFQENDVARVVAQLRSVAAGQVSR